MHAQMILWVEVIGGERVIAPGVLLRERAFDLGMKSVWLPFSV